MLICASVSLFIDQLLFVREHDVQKQTMAAADDRNEMNQYGKAMI